MKFKKFKYLLYLIILLLLALLFDKLIMMVQNLVATTYSYMYIKFFIKLCALIIMGILLDFPRIFKEFKKSGTWHVNLHKIIYILIPSAIIPLLLAVYLSGIHINSEFIKTYFFNTNSLLYQFSCLSFGFFLSNSFSKVQNN